MSKYLRVSHFLVTTQTSITTQHFYINYSTFLSLQIRKCIWKSHKKLEKVTELLSWYNRSLIHGSVVYHFHHRSCHHCPNDTPSSKALWSSSSRFLTPSPRSESVTTKVSTNSTLAKYLHQILIDTIAGSGFFDMLATQIKMPFFLFFNLDLNINLPFGSVTISARQFERSMSNLS